MPKWAVRWKMSLREQESTPNYTYTIAKVRSRRQAAYRPYLPALEGNAANVGTLYTASYMDIPMHCVLRKGLSRQPWASMWEAGQTSVRGKAAGLHSPAATQPQHPEGGLRTMAYSLCSGLCPALRAHQGGPQLHCPSFAAALPLPAFVLSHSLSVFSHRITVNFLFIPANSKLLNLENV